MIVSANETHEHMSLVSSSELGKKHITTGTTFKKYKNNLVYLSSANILFDANRNFAQPSFAHRSFTLFIFRSVYLLFNIL